MPPLPLAAACILHLDVFEREEIELTVLGRVHVEKAAKLKEVEVRVADVHRTLLDLFEELERIVVAQLVRLLSRQLAHALNEAVHCQR